jgi:serine/threonine protein phosphatase PrpC
MGTTVVAVAFEDDIMSVAHVGDSRAYRLDKTKVLPLTIDHSWVAEVQRNSNISEEEAGSIVGKNVITRALGVRENVEVDYRVMKVQTGDLFILCSDGLCGFASDTEIFEAASPVRHDVHKIVDKLIKLANDKGGHDNVTVIAIQVMDVKKSDRFEIETITTVAEDDETLEVEDEWLEAMGDARDIMENSGSQPSSPKNKYLFAIFGAFIILAVLIIYFTSFR